MKYYAVYCAAILMLPVVAVSLAADPGHTDHKVVPVAVKLVGPPASGKARESGYEGSDMMEATSLENPANVQCAHAARGLVMLDRATLAGCGGESAPAAPPAATGHTHH